jgi:hypothetical protein
MPLVDPVWLAGYFTGSPVLGADALYRRFERDTFCSAGGFSRN